MDPKNTMIQISKDTAKQIKASKIYTMETYDEIIKRILQQKDKKDICRK
jgi:hypothetical protein